jgi:hypothetical protein
LQQTLPELRSYRDWTCNGLLEFRKALVTHFRYLCPRPGKDRPKGLRSARLPQVQLRPTSGKLQNSSEVLAFYSLNWVRRFR